MVMKRQLSPSGPVCRQIAKPHSSREVVGQPRGVQGNDAHTYDEVVCGPASGALSLNPRILLFYRWTRPSQALCSDFSTDTQFT